MNSNFRSILTEAATTANWPGGDRWLAREIRREIARNSLQEMTELRNDTEKFIAAVFVAARDFISCGDWREVKDTLEVGREAIESEGNEQDVDKMNELLRAADYWLEDQARYPKRYLRRERRMLWRDERRKRPLQRALRSRTQFQPKRSRRFYRVHFRINQRAAHSA